MDVLQEEMDDDHYKTFIKKRQNSQMQINKTFSSMYYAQKNYERLA